MLANPGNLGLSPSGEGEKRSPITLIKQWKGGGTEDAKQPLRKIPYV